MARVDVVRFVRTGDVERDVLVGTESMIVFQDVLCLDEKAARKTKSWAARTLVAAALAESDKPNSR